jgi:hypothetical protein
MSAVQVAGGPACERRRAPARAVALTHTCPCPAQVLNVPPSADEASLREFFAFCGTVTVSPPSGSACVRPPSALH